MRCLSAEIESRVDGRYRLLFSQPEIQFIHFFFYSIFLFSDATGNNRIWVCDLLSIAIVFFSLQFFRFLSRRILIVIHPFPDTRVKISTLILQLSIFPKFTFRLLEFQIFHPNIIRAFHITFQHVHR